MGVVKEYDVCQNDRRLSFVTGMVKISIRDAMNCL